MIRNVIFTLLFILIQTNVVAKSNENDKVELTEKQVRALQSLNEPLQTPQYTPQYTQQLKQQQKQSHKSLRVKLTKLKDNQGQVYLGAIISRAELSSYLVTLEQLLGNNFQKYRALQAARDHQLFHVTMLTPQEYQLADKTLVEKLLAPDFNSNFSSQLSVTLLGLGMVEQSNKKTYFVVAQSNDAQLIRQRFLLNQKDFHITLGFNPSDIYGVKKDNSTLIDLAINP